MKKQITINLYSQHIKCLRTNTVCISFYYLKSGKFLYLFAMWAKSCTYS